MGETALDIKAFSSKAEKSERYLTPPEGGNSLRSSLKYFQKKQQLDQLLQGTGSGARQPFRHAPNIKAAS